MSKSEMGRHSAAIQIKHVEGQVSETRRFPCDLVVELPSSRITGDGTSLPPLPSRSFYVIDALKDSGISLGEPMQHQRPFRRELAEPAAQVCPELRVRALEPGTAAPVGIGERDIGSPP